MTSDLEWQEQPSALRMGGDAVPYQRSPQCNLRITVIYKIINNLANTLQIGLCRLLAEEQWNSPG